ncbi:HAD family hydrolase [Streptococcus sp. 32226D021BW]
MALKGIIFDMDGVLFDTEHFYYQRRADFLATKGLSVAHLDPAIFVGGRVSQIWQLVLGKDYDQWDIPQLEAEYKTYKESHVVPYGQLVFPDAATTLASLAQAGLRLALASNTDKSEIERALAEAGLRTYFDHVFSAMDCRAGKPDPEVYEKASQALGFEKAELLVIEDSPKGIEAGKAAGLTVWAIEDKQLGLDQSQADEKIANLSQLHTVIKRA